MNTKKFLAGVFTCLILMAASCTTDTAEDQLYDQALDKTKVKRLSLDKTKVKTLSLDKTKIGSQKGK